MTRTNNVVIAHEILHTLGASDKYDPDTLAPLYPDRLRGAGAGASFSADHSRKSWPAVTRSTRAPSRCRSRSTEVVVGDSTALEIRWIRE